MEISRLRSKPSRQLAVSSPKAMTILNEQLLPSPTNLAVRANFAVLGFVGLGEINLGVEYFGN